jgi:hypothetical protein
MKGFQQILKGKLHNTRSVGKPRTSWEDVVMMGALQILGIRGWGTRAGGGGKQRRVVHFTREARAHKVL